MLSCSFPKFPTSGSDAEKVFLLADEREDEDPFSADYNWKKGKSICTHKFKFETEFKLANLKTVGSNKDYIFIQISSWNSNSSSYQTEVVVIKTD